MQILSIGNSFSCDAHSYLYRISHAEKNDLSAINLSIGGCTLERHYRNMLGDRRDYSLLVGGLSTVRHTRCEVSFLQKFIICFLSFVSKPTLCWRKYQFSKGVHYVYH